MVNRKKWTIEQKERHRIKMILSHSSPEVREKISKNGKGKHTCSEKNKKLIYHWDSMNLGKIWVSHLWSGAMFIPHIW